MRWSTSFWWWSIRLINYYKRRSWWRRTTPDVLQLVHHFGADIMTICPVLLCSRTGRNLSCTPSCAYRCIPYLNLKKIVTSNRSLVCKIVLLVKDKLKIHIIKNALIVHSLTIKSISCLSPDKISIKNLFYSIQFSHTDPRSL